MAQAVARIACADIKHIPVFSMTGEKKTLELKENAMFTQIKASMGDTLPENLKDPKLNER